MRRSHLCDKSLTHQSFMSAPISLDISKILCVLHLLVFVYTESHLAEVPCAHQTIALYISQIFCLCDKTPDKTTQERKRLFEFTVSENSLPSPQVCKLLRPR